VIIASAQFPGDPSQTPIFKVPPVAGAPFVAQQVEERTHIFPNGASSTTVIRSNIYRDAIGRMRLEWAVKSSRCKSLPIAYLFDPVASSTTVLLIPSKVARRTIKPLSIEIPTVFPEVGDPLPKRQWSRITEALGKRTIDGFEVEGIRSTVIAEDRPELHATYNSWFSKDLGSTLLTVDASGPNWAYTERLENIDRRDPDPALFICNSSDLI
jgi:hypothetical protein